MQFALALRDLQSRTGGSVRLAQRYGVSRTAAYEALAGKRLPSNDTLERIVIAWGVDEELTRWRTLRRRVEGELAIEARLRGEVKIKKTPEEGRFHEALIRLWEDAGKPSRNAWGEAAGLSPRTVGAYLDGKTMPMPEKLALLIAGLVALCAADSELESWIEQQGEIIRGEHLHQARVARKAAKDEARMLAKALPGGQPRD
ncbi:hypothetical protein [Streptomyces rimosus]|uniref:hypothetical protein n=1 Tax=Streptomyces rimosus TaxID=1927 RepID=UPI00131BF646|nr:hypothetical protein [Streptomyces rimosus]